MPLRRAACGFLILVTLGAAIPSAAQEDSSPIDLVRLGLEGAPFWYGPGDDLDLRIGITNGSAQTLGGFRLSIAAYDRVSTRFGLEISESLDPTTTLPSSAFSRDFTEAIAPGATTIVLIEDPIETLLTLSGEPASGVYPLTVTLLDAGGLETGATLTSPGIFYAEPAEPPLDLVTVVPLNEIPAQDPAGVFMAGESGSNPLEEAIGPAGWLRGEVSALEERAGRGFAFALAPSPRLIDELTDMADGYVRGTAGGRSTFGQAAGPATAAAAILVSLRTILEKRGVQPMLSPYSWADLSALSRLELEPLAQQLTVGGRALQALQVPISSRWVLAPLGRIDEQVLSRLKDTSPEAARRMIFSPLSLIQSEDPALGGCPVGSPSFACPIVVPSAFGRTVGFESDPRLQDHLATMSEPGSERLALQRLLAETSMIREELPGRSGRVVQMTLPASLHLSPLMSHLFFKALSRAPWLHTLTPNRAIDEAVALEPRDLIDVLPAAAQDPGDEFFATIEEARTTVETFASISPPAQLLERLRRNILVAYSRSWWESDDLLERGADFATEAQSEARRHLDAISVLNVPEITLTSRKGEVQLLVGNDNDFPVTVSIQLTSLDLRLEDGGKITSTFPANKTTQVVMGATAQKSGIFPVQVSVKTVDGEQTIYGPHEIRIRSTELNRIAVGITFGAFAFLVCFYLFRSFRGRRTAAPEAGMAA